MEFCIDVAAFAQLRIKKRFSQEIQSNVIGPGMFMRWYIVHIKHLELSPQTVLVITPSLSILHPTAISLWIISVMETSGNQTGSWLMMSVLLQKWSYGALKIQIYINFISFIYLEGQCTFISWYRWFPSAGLRSEKGPGFTVLSQQDAAKDTWPSMQGATNQHK